MRIKAIPTGPWLGSQKNQQQIYNTHHLLGNELVFSNIIGHAPFPGLKLGVKILHRPKSTVVALNSQVTLLPQLHLVHQFNSNL